MFIVLSINKSNLIIQFNLKKCFECIYNPRTSTSVWTTTINSSLFQREMGNDRKSVKVLEQYFKYSHAKQTPAKRKK